MLPRDGELLWRTFEAYWLATGVIAVLKGDAYGHGAVEVADYLTRHKAIDRIAVATVGEAVQMRAANIPGPIHVLGNIQRWEVNSCLTYDLIPTISCEETIRSMGEALQKWPRTNHHTSVPTVPTGNGSICNGDVNDQSQSQRSLVSPPKGAIHIKVDTGMGRNGCLPKDLHTLVQACEDSGVPLEGIFTHLCHHEDPEFSHSQLSQYLQLIQPYRKKGYFFHSSCSGPVVMQLGTEFDFIRPGVSIYGMPPIPDVEQFAAMGFRPALCVKGMPTLVKCHSLGSKVGYSCTYTVQQDEEWIAAFPMGFGDGFWRALGEEKGSIVRDKTGEKCPVVGRVSMDAITVRLPCQPDENETFTLVTADFDPVTSVTGIAEAMDTITNEVLIRLPPRLPRVYLNNKGKVINSREALYLPHGTFQGEIK